MLASWARERRELRWRETLDPWVVVCEVMAQQTQVARVAEVCSWVLG